MLIIFGSVNMDMTLPVPSMPIRGETMVIPAYEITPGGKGANQALAAARMGVQAVLVGRVGKDVYAYETITTIRRQGVVTSGVSEDETLPTGTAIILREPDGSNRIIVANGANKALEHDQVPDEILKPTNTLLAQMEVAPQQVFTLIRRAHEKKVKILLNAAPACDIPADVLQMVDVLIVNEVEAARLADFCHLKHDNTPEGMAHALAGVTHKTCIVTLGPDGSVAVLDDGSVVRVPSLPIDRVVDTTGAGDAYCGTLAALLADKMNIREALRWAAVAGSLACAKKGALSAFAYSDDIRDALKDLPPV
ncbi:ribokinase [Micavibrio aeruginosavorus]|uniref:Ribokinase n=1 Tax=Micavibrio aeruginosavorus EPB TaxID=349215 RepID=M4VWG2_9BACT|nr:ribokinase [Micavibrio aeruginosavorus]AGH97524.1 Ribokinase [Micavibrio aeruginosavorus EPB]